MQLISCQVNFHCLNNKVIIQLSNVQTISVYLFKKDKLPRLSGLLFHLFNIYKVEKYIACENFEMHKCVNTWQPWLPVLILLLNHSHVICFNQNIPISYFFLQVCICIIIFFFCLPWFFPFLVLFWFFLLLGFFFCWVFSFVFCIFVYVTLVLLSNLFQYS